MQSRKHSFIEQVTSTAVGYIVAVTGQVAIFPFFGIHIPLHDSMLIGVWFTGISLVCEYVVRRWFNRKAVKISQSLDLPTLPYDSYELWEAALIAFILDEGISYSMAQRIISHSIFRSCFLQDLSPKEAFRHWENIGNNYGNYNTNTKK